MWRTVNKEGGVLDVLVQKRRNKIAPMKLLRKLLMNQGFIPDTIVTDDLAFHEAAMREIGCRDRQRPGRLRDNNRPRTRSCQSDVDSERCSASSPGAGPAVRLNPQRSTTPSNFSATDLPKHDAPVPIRSYGGVARRVRRSGMNLTVRAFARRRKSPWQCRFFSIAGSMPSAICYRASSRLARAAAEVESLHACRGTGS